MKRTLLLTLLLVAGCEDGDGVPTVRFPGDFLWGTASAAYQVEGTEDPVMGTVSSNWPRFVPIGADSWIVVRQQVTHRSPPS